MKAMKVLPVVMSLAIMTLFGISGPWAQDKSKVEKAAPAAKPGFSRNVLQKVDTSVPGREAVQIIAELAAGVTTGKHSHPGEEIGYLLEGGPFTMTIEGKPAITLKTGDHFFVPANTVHEGKNTGSGPAKVLVTYVVEKGKPLATPAK
jgi:quercetin dioxygenase-like cupin family protein